MAKVKDKYRDEDAKKNQEVVTPPDLVDHIYSFLSEDDFKGKDILDPCVGPGALIEPILKKAYDWKWRSLTVMDIQKLHIENFKKNLANYRK
jgi:hypothetical protein